MKTKFNLFGFVMAVITFNGLLFGLRLTPEEMKGAVEDAMKNHAEKVDEVKKAHEDLDGKIAHMQKSIEKGQEDAVDKDAFAKLNEKAAKSEKALEDIAEKLQKGFFGGTKKEKSLGDLVAESKAADQWAASGGKHANIANWNGSLFSKDITSGAASAGDLVEPMVVSGIISEPEQQLTIRDLLMTLPTSSNAIEWVKELVYTNAAAPQAGEGAVKPKSDITFEKQTTAVQTLAHWFAVSEQVLSDAPALRAHIEKRGRYGLKLKEEEQLLLGDGTGNNLHGLIPQATAYNVALSVSGDKKLDQLRRMILQVAQAHYPTDGFVLNPADWCAIELTKTSDNAYLFANPVNGTAPRVWGKRVVEGLSMTEGQFLGGAFMTAATLYDRQQVNVKASDSHADFFIENMVAIRIEERLALTVERPAAIVKGTLADTA